MIRDDRRPNNSGFRRERGIIRTRIAATMPDEPRDAVRPTGYLKQTLAPLTLWGRGVGYVIAGAGPPTGHLKQPLGPLTLWGLGAGRVISGEYFGWNLGLPAGGTYGLLLAFLLVTLMYVTFVFSYAELACAIPRAGGVFVYGVRALGLTAGYLGGVAQVIEFVFAPPAIAMAIGAYGHTWWPAADPRAIALAAYLVFTGLNLWGVKQAALFELWVTILAVGELLLFCALAAPHFRLENFTANAWPHGWSGVLAAIPFAVWFYLAIEGVANAAEEARHPQRDVALGFGSAIATLVVLAAGVLVLAIGVGGWERIVYAAADLTARPDGAWHIHSGAATSDSPLPLALGQIFDSTHLLYHLLIGIGGLGLIASLNGIILIAGRALLEMGRVRFLPEFIGRVHPGTGTPVNALLLNLLIGTLSILFLDTGRLITMSAMGAVTLYIVAMWSLLRLRVTEPDLPRPFRTPFYPVFPLVAMAIAAFSFVAMLSGNFDPADLSGSVSVWYFASLAAAFVWYFVIVRQGITPADVAHFHRSEIERDA